jgi:hypothetical protein
MITVISAVKAHFPLGEFVCANSKKIEINPTFSLPRLMFFASREQIRL